MQILYVFSLIVNSLYFSFVQLVYYASVLFSIRLNSLYIAASLNRIEAALKAVANELAKGGEGLEVKSKLIDELEASISEWRGEGSQRTVAKQKRFNERGHFSHLTSAIARAKRLDLEKQGVLFLLCTKIILFYVDYSVAKRFHHGDLYQKFEDGDSSFAKNMRDLLQAFITKLDHGRSDAESYISIFFDDLTIEDLLINLRSRQNSLKDGSDNMKVFSTYYYAYSHCTLFGSRASGGGAAPNILLPFANLFPKPYRDFEKKVAILLGIISDKKNKSYGIWQTIKSMIEILFLVGALIISAQSLMPIFLSLPFALWFKSTIALASVIIVDHIICSNYKGYFPKSLLVYNLAHLTTSTASIRNMLLEIGNNFIKPLSRLNKRIDMSTLCFFIINSFFLLDYYFSSLALPSYIQKHYYLESYLDRYFFLGYFSAQLILLSKSRAIQNAIIFNLSCFLLLLMPSAFFGYMLAQQAFYLVALSAALFLIADTIRSEESPVLFFYPTKEGIIRDVFKYTLCFISAILLLFGIYNTSKLTNDGAEEYIYHLINSFNNINDKVFGACEYIFNCSSFNLKLGVENSLRVFYVMQLLFVITAAKVSSLNYYLKNTWFANIPKVIALSSLAMLIASFLNMTSARKDTSTIVLAVSTYAAKDISALVGAPMKLFMFAKKQGTRLFPSSSTDGNRIDPDADVREIKVKP